MKNPYTETWILGLAKIFYRWKVPKNWQLHSIEKNYLDSINIVNEKSVLLEQDTVRLTEKKEWLFCKIANINTYRAHRILIKQHNLESLANDRPQSVKANMRNKKAYNEIDCSRKIPQRNVFLSKPWRAVTRAWFYNSASFVLDCCDTWWSNITRIN